MLGCREIYAAVVLILVFAPPSRQLRRCPKEVKKWGKMENVLKNENRRDFLKASGAGVGGLALGFSLQLGP